MQLRLNQGMSKRRVPIPGTFGYRLRLARKRRGLSQPALADLTELQQPNLSKMELGDTQETAGIARLADTLRVPASWLERGIGPEPDWEATPTTAPRLSALGDNFGPPGRPRSPFLLESPPVPLISWVAAGLLCETQEPLPPGEAQDWLVCPVKHGLGTFALKVQGDSMDGSGGYRDGELIFVDPTVEARPGRDVVVCTPDGKATFKRLKEDSEGLYLYALNDAFPNRVVRVPEGTMFCGVVIYSSMVR